MPRELGKKSSHDAEIYILLCSLRDESQTKPHRTCWAPPHWCHGQPHQLLRPKDCLLPRESHTKMFAHVTKSRWVVPHPITSGRDEATHSFRAGRIHEPGHLLPTPPCRDGYLGCPPNEACKKLLPIPMLLPSTSPALHQAIMNQTMLSNTSALQGGRSLHMYPRFRQKFLYVKPNVFLKHWQRS